MTGLIAALGVTMHNFPEGLVVYTQTIGGVCHGLDLSVSLMSLAGLRHLTQACASRGIVVTMAIALHNIPEGMAVASPIMASTGSSWEALKWCLLSSVAEPIGAVTFGLLFNKWLTPHVAAVVNCVVAGIMIMLCIVELIPTAAQHTSPKNAALSNVLGQLLMFLSVQYMVETGMHEDALQHVEDPQHVSIHTP
jgi:ZIP family zinc transporter